MGFVVVGLILLIVVPLLIKLGKVQKTHNETKKKKGWTPEKSAWTNDSSLERQQITKPQKPLEPLDTPMTLSFNVAGVTFDNRQAYIKRTVKKGDDLILKRDSNNDYDNHAIKVVHNGTVIGYVPSRRSKEITNYLKAGADYQARVYKRLMPKVDKSKPAGIKVKCKRTN